MIRGETVYIRVIQVEDAQIVLQWENDKDNWKYSENEGEYILLDILHLIDTMRDVKKAGQVRYIICDNESHEQLGTVDLFSIDFDKHFAEIGVLIANKKNRQKGIAKESVILIEEAALDLGVNRISATVQDDNEPSIRLFKSAGYDFIEKLEDNKSLYIKCLGR